MRLLSRFFPPRPKRERSAQKTRWNEQISDRRKKCIAGAGIVLALCSQSLLQGQSDESFPPTEEEVVDHVFSLTLKYLSGFQHPDTGVLYGSRLATKNSWTSPEDVLKEIPHPWGYGSRIADTTLHTGHMLVALLDAWEARPDRFLERQIRIHFDALRFIGSLPETHPKPGKPALEGLVPRGPHPDNDAAYFDDSSMDQHTTYIISLAIFAHSPLATDEDKKWINESLGKVGRRLEANEWAIMRADGITQAHVGFSWKGFNSGHASILLPSVLALYHGTGDRHWLNTYENFLTENKAKRWEQVHPGPHVRINGHPIYANQNAFRVNAWYQLETNKDRRNVIGGLLKQSVEMQLARDFPGEFYRKYHSEETWNLLRNDFDWGHDDLRGAALAWKKFQPGMLDHKESGLAALAHVRFPLGGFHMVLLSEQPEIIQDHLAEIWEMLRTVNLEKVAAGETHYLFTVVALHLYAHYFREAAAFEAAASTPEKSAFGPELPIVKNAEIGPTKDVAVEGDHAYAIGKSSLSVLDISNPRKPVTLGRLRGLGSVRQIVVQEGIAYISARQDGLFIVDARDPSNPKLLNHYDTIEFATGLAISGDILFVACRHYGVELVDISNPGAPRHLSTVRTGEAQSVVAQNGFLYAGVWATSEVVTIDFKNPKKPQITSRSALDGFGDGVDVAGDFLYAATGHHSKETPRKKPGDPGFGKGHGLEIFDLSDPAKPQWVSRIKFPPLYEIGNDTWRVTAANGHAFVTDTYNGLFVVDVSEPAIPRVVGHHQLPPAVEGKPAGFVGGLALIEDHIFLAGGDTDLHILAAPDIAKTPPKKTVAPLSIPTREPNLIEPGWRAYQPDGQVHGVDFLDDDRAIIACGTDGIHLVELWPEIKRLSRFETEGFATDVSVVGELVFIAESAGGLSICQLEKGGNTLHQIGHFKHGTQAIRQIEVPGDGQFALLQAGASRFLVVDVSDPTSPKLVLEEARHGLLYGDQMMRGLVEDRYTAVFWHVSGLHWYDLKAEPTPVFSGDIYPERIGAANGHLAFQGKSLATLRGGYLLLDRKEQRSAKETGAYQITNLRRHLGVPYVSGDRLYTANRAEGIVTVIDISDPEKPSLIEEIGTPGNPTRVSVRNDSLIIPDGYHGLLIRN